MNENMLLVTGITGHSGRYFLQELINNKYEGNIRCIIRNTSDTSIIDNSGLKVEKIIGSLEDQEFIDRAMIGVSTVMHIYNIHHSPAIVKAAIKNNINKVILVHTTGIYSQFKNASQEYKEIEKKVIELVGEDSCKISVAILRPTMIYGDLCDHNISKFIRLIDKLRIVPVINNGSSLLQPVNARDLGKAYYDVLMLKMNLGLYIYNLSGDRPIRIIDMLKLISTELNKRTVFVSISLRLSVFGAKILKVITFGNIDIVEKVQRMGENRDYSHEAATNDFGYTPMFFEEGIKIEIKEYLQKCKTY